MATAASGDASGNAAADLLVIILDTNPFAWQASSEETEVVAKGLEGSGGNDSLSFDEAVKNTLVLCNAHMALRFENQLAVYSAGLGSSELLYSSIDAQQAASKRNAGAILLPSEPAEVDEEGDDLDDMDNAKDSNSYQTFRIVDNAVTAALRQLQKNQEVEAGMQNRPVAISGALSKALCHISRLSKDESLPPMKARILILSVSGETSSQYIPIMNCIFAAQKASIPIDVCKIFGDDTVFLQQASHLTKASYYRLERRSGLLQYLLMAFLPGMSVRKFLHLPGQEQIDLRAACFCHKKIVDIGYVCSICLSIFCSPIPVCRTCRTKFPIASLRSLMGTGGAALGAGAAGPGGQAKKRKLPSTAQPNGGPSNRPRNASTPAPPSAPSTPGA